MISHGLNLHTKTENPIAGQPDKPDDDNPTTIVAPNVNVLILKKRVYPCSAYSKTLFRNNTNHSVQQFGARSVR